MPALAIAALVTAGVFVLGAQRTASRSAASRGEAIFQSGVAANRKLIPRTASGVMMGGGGMIGGGMMRAGCATCHGSDGHGRSIPTFTSPSITHGNLTDPQAMLQPDGTCGV